MRDLGIVPNRGWWIVITAWTIGICMGLADNLWVSILALVLVMPLAHIVEKKFHAGNT